MIKSLEDITLKIRALWNQFNAALNLLYLAYQLIDENKFAKYKYGNLSPIEGRLVKHNIKKFLDQMSNYPDYKDDRFYPDRWKIEDKNGN